MGKTDAANYGVIDETMTGDRGSQNPPCEQAGLLLKEETILMDDPFESA